MAARHDAHGHWLAEVGPLEPAPALAGDSAADVVVVGGGYTGMWAAWHAKRLEPAARIALCEAGTCGQGPSGRNGGFVNSFWFLLPTLRERLGDAAALTLARAAAASVGEIGAFCEREGVDAWYRRSGYLQVSTARAWDGGWSRAVAACRELGAPEAVRALSPEQVRERCASPLFRAGAFYPHAATVHPARLARGLRERLRERGVEVFERSEVVNVAPAAGGALVRTDGGTIRAGAVVLAAGGGLAALRRLRHRLTLTSSHMVITEPVPELLEELGWTGGECITDSRATVHYFRTTREGRVAFGWGGGRVVPGARTGGRAEVDRRIAAEVERRLLRFFPGLEGRRIEHAWGGPIDVSPTHLPVIGSLDAPIHYAFGYTGNGVGPSQLVGRALASLALERRDWASRLAIVDPEPVRVPPEPLRYLGGTVIRRALVRKEDALDEDRRPGPLTGFLAGIPERIGIHVGR